MSHTDEASPPALPDTKEAAQQWLVWARAHYHQPSCACHGCIAARALLAGRPPHDSHGPTALGSGTVDGTATPTSTPPERDDSA